MDNEKTVQVSNTNLHCSLGGKLRWVWMLRSCQIEADILTIGGENAFYKKEGELCCRWKPACSPCISECLP